MDKKTTTPSHASRSFLYFIDKNLALLAFVMLDRSRLTKREEVLFYCRDRSNCLNKILQEEARTISPNKHIGIFFVSRSLFHSGC